MCIVMHQDCEIVMHQDCDSLNLMSCYSLVLFARVIRSCYSLVLFARVIRSCYSFVLFARVIRSCYSLVLFARVIRSCYLLVLFARVMMLIGHPTCWCWLYLPTWQWDDTTVYSRVIPCQFNKFLDVFPRTPSDCFEIWYSCRTW